MRKKIISIVITLPILLGIGIGSMTYTNSLSHDNANAIREMEEFVRIGDLEGAQQILTEVSDGWDKSKSLLNTWVDHLDTDLVSTCLKAVQVGLTLQDEATIFVNSAALIEAFEHLNHRDDLSWYNIL